MKAKSYALFNLTSFFFALLATPVLMEVNQLSWGVVLAINGVFFFSLVLPVLYFVIHGSVEQFQFTKLFQNNLQEEEKQKRKNYRDSLNLLAGGVAHEINNPLAIMMGNIEYIEKYIGKMKIENERVTKYFSMIKASSQRIESITQNLRYFAQDPEHEEHSYVCIKSLINKISEFFIGQTVALGIELNVFFEDAENKLIYLNCKELQLSHALLSIIFNSIEAVRAENAEKWIRIFVSQTADLNETRIKIVDSGKGIPKNILDQIMVPFFTTKDVGYGPGLGLSSAKGIIADHSGNLEYVDGEPNTTFEITLPSFNHSFEESNQSLSA
jgi:signal transduction histidine kinase